MSRKEEEKGLLAHECEPAGYGTDVRNPEDASPPGEANSDQPPQEKGPPQPRNSKRTRLQRSPSLSKVDEDAERGSEQRKSSGCSDYIGVKSYLHHFYAGRSFKDPDVYEDDDDFRYLLHPNRKHRRCASIWWKVFVWIGANFLIFGIIGVLVGYLVPQKNTLVDRPAVATNLQLIDHEAITFNYNLDVCKLVGLILFCIGGVTLTVALLFPSFLYQWCDDDRREAAFLVRAREQHEPHSPVEMTVPATPTITEVQPDRKQDESVITKDGILPYKD